jgi:hypothetical protein
MASPGAGRDPQLERAAAEIMAAIERDPVSLPQRPPGELFSLAVRSMARLTGRGGTVNIHERGPMRDQSAIEDDKEERMRKTLCVAWVLVLAVGGSLWAANSFTRNGSGEPVNHTVLVPTPGPHSITQNSDTSTITTGNSVSCNAGGLHTDNSYLRRFTMADYGITNQFDVANVDVGVEQATGATGTQPIEIRLHSILTAAAFTFANLTSIGTSVTTVADAAAVVVNFPVTGSLVDPVATNLVLEVFTPNGQTAGNSFFIGSNTAPETAASYLAAADCGVTEPTPVAAIGFPDMHIVMIVNGDELPVELQSFNVE